MSSLPTHILYSAATPIEIDVDVVPAATQTVTLRTGDGGAIFSDQNVTASTISTTISASASAGDRTITVASATGISSDREFWLRTPNEKVKCKTISGTTVTLYAPLVYSHASSSTAEGTRLTYTVTAAQAATMFWDGSLQWIIDVDTNTERHYHQACICTRYPFYRVATLVDWRAEEPKVSDLIEDELDVERFLDEALAEVIERIAAKTEGRAWAYRGPHQFKRATIFAAQMAHYRHMAGDEAERLYRRYIESLDDELQRVVAGIATRDTDQDQIPEATEQFIYQSVRKYRA